MECVNVHTYECIVPRQEWRGGGGTLFRERKYNDRSVASVKQGLCRHSVYLLVQPVLHGHMFTGREVARQP